MRPHVIACACLLDLACVTQANYDSLAADRDRVARELAGARESAARRQSEDLEHLREQQTTLDRCTQRVADLEADSSRKLENILTLEGRALDLEADLTRLQAELARLVKDRSRLNASVEDMQRALASLIERERETQRRLAEYRDVLTRFKDLIDAGKLQVRVVDGRMVLTLPMDILFASGSAKLSREGSEALSELGHRLLLMPARRLQIEGHTDNVPIHTASYPSNWELASARALVVVRALLDTGIPADRVSAASFAEYHPTASNTNDDDRARNRRIEIVLVPDLSLLPGYAELKKLAGDR